MIDSKAQFHFEKGLIYFQKGDYLAATTYFMEAIGENPVYPEALYNLACCCSMSGDRDQAVVYLYRAARVNPQCLTWAQQDFEFDKIREYPTFQKILNEERLHFSRNGMLEPSDDLDDEEELLPNSDSEEERIIDDSEILPVIESLPPPNLDDGKKRKVKDESAFPPCIRCEGLIEIQQRPRYNTILMLLIAFGGLLCCTLLFVTWYGVLGLGIIAVGLYFFSISEDVWVCQNCGARKEQCGQSGLLVSANNPGAVPPVPPKDEMGQGGTNTP